MQAIAPPSIIALPPEILRILSFFLDAITVANLRQCCHYLYHNVLHQLVHLSSLFPNFIKPYSIAKETYITTLIQLNQSLLYHCTISIETFFPHLLIKHGYYNAISYLLMITIDRDYALVFSLRNEDAIIEESSNGNEKPKEIFMRYTYLAHCLISGWNSTSTSTTFPLQLFQKLTFYSLHLSEYSSGLVRDQFVAIMTHSLLKKQFETFSWMFEHFHVVRDTSYLLCKDNWYQFQECTRLILKNYIHWWENHLIHFNDAVSNSSTDGFSNAYHDMFGLNLVAKVLQSENGGQVSPYSSNADINSKPILEIIYTEEEIQLCKYLFYGKEAEAENAVKSGPVRFSFSTFPHQLSIHYHLVDFVALGHSPDFMMQCLVRLVKKYQPLPKCSSLSQVDVSSILLSYAYRLSEMKKPELAEQCFRAGVDPNSSPSNVVLAFCNKVDEYVKLCISYGFRFENISKEDLDLLTRMELLDKFQQFQGKDSI